MTDLVHDLREMRAGFASRVARLGTMLRRLTPGPALVRGGVYLAGLVAQLAGWPSQVILGRPLLLFAVVALLPALFPRGIWPGVVILTAVVGWLAATTVYAEAPTYLRLVIVAGAVYLLHSLAALAAVLPYDAVVAAGVLGRWLLHAALVVVLTAALALFAVAVPGWVGTGRYLLASVVGLAVMAGLAGYLASLVRRRS